MMMMMMINDIRSTHVHNVYRYARVNVVAHI